MSATRWERIEDLFTQAAEMPEPARTAFLERACGADETLQTELHSLLQSYCSAGSFLESPSRNEGDEATDEFLGTGVRFGPWRVVRSLGRGGMGEVYEVERADGAFNQRAALKLLRREAASQMERFNLERSLLARLEHPGIVRLLDGGVADDGRPWAVLDYVEGSAITNWCQEHGSSLRERLSLFTQVCDAVACAHRRLVVHRDLKPSNILVDAEGRVRLLDFGIAKVLDPIGKDDVATVLSQTPLTPDYCAPEQLTGEPVTTATDVYTLGLLLFELLTAQRPWPIDNQPLARAFRTLLEAPAPLPSKAVRANAPVSARQLRGDLDAIVARCLRKESAHRYSTVEALKLDVERSLSGQPVAAREGARWYLFGRFLRCYRWAVAATGVLIVVLIGGLAGVTWQARKAQAQADRAETTKRFLVEMFSASDPRLAAEKLPGQTTARELLDRASSRIDTEFASQPELKLELLGTAAEIYSKLNEKERHSELRSQQLALAHPIYNLHPIVIDGYLVDADFATSRGDYAEALRLLNVVDPLIHNAGLDDTTRRARWWREWGEAQPSMNTHDGLVRREQALLRAVEMYGRIDRADPLYSVALREIAFFSANYYGDMVRARTYLLRAADALESARPNDWERASLDFLFGEVEEFNGNLTSAMKLFGRSAQTFRHTTGQRDYANALAKRGEIACLTGDRETAHALFDEASLGVKPESPEGLNIADDYADCLVREGRATEAIPILQHDPVKDYEPGKDFEWDIDSKSAMLETIGAAFAQVGRNEDARTALRGSFEGRSAWQMSGDPRLLESRELWGSFLLMQSESTAAEAQFREIIDHDSARNLAYTALAYGGLARLAIQKHEPNLALKHSAEALRIYGIASGFRDVRMEPYLWRVRAQALALSGDFASAQDFAQRSLDAFRHYNDPSSPEIAESETVLGAIRQHTQKQSVVGLKRAEEFAVKPGLGQRPVASDRAQ